MRKQQEENCMRMLRIAAMITVLAMCLCLFAGCETKLSGKYGDEGINGNADIVVQVTAAEPGVYQYRVYDHLVDKPIEDYKVLDMSEYELTEETGKYVVTTGDMVYRWTGKTWAIIDLRDIVVGSILTITRDAETGELVWVILNDAADEPTGE